MIVLLLACKDTPPAAPIFADHAARVHADIGSLVYASWSQSVDLESGWVEYSVDEGEWLSTPAASWDAGDHEALLLGVPFGATVTWRLAYDDGEVHYDTAQAAAADPLPAGLPELAVVIADPTAWEPTGNYLLGSIKEEGGGWSEGNFWKFIIDRQGRYVWAMLTPDKHWSISLRQSRSGADILWDEATYWSDWGSEGYDSKVHRMKIDGTIVKTYDTPGLHHPFVELPDDILAWGDASGDWFERLVQHDGSGGVEEIWDCESFLDAVKPAGKLEQQELWKYSYCESNTLYWHEATDTFLYSFYTSSTMVEIDHATGETLWYAGHLDGSYDFVPEESLFEWQHGGHWTEEGTLLLSSMADCADPDNCGHGAETVAWEYAVDHEAGTLTELWSYGKGEGWLANTAGEAWRLPSGNILHNYGSAGALKEVTADGEVVWQVEGPYNHLLGRTTFIEDLYDFAP